MSKHISITVELLIAEEDYELLSANGCLAAEIGSAVYQYCRQQREVEAFFAAHGLADVASTAQPTNADDEPSEFLQNVQTAISDAMAEDAPPADSRVRIGHPARLGDRKIV